MPVDMKFRKNFICYCIGLAVVSEIQFSLKHYILLVSNKLERLKYYKT